MLLVLARDEIAKTIHESRYPTQPWESLPGTPANPQRYYARQAADAVLKLLGANEAVVNGFVEIETGITPVGQAIEEATK